MRSIRDKNRNINPEKIEQDIKDLEFKLAHETLPDQEEKRVQTQLTQLTAARPLAKKYAEFDARLKETEAQRTGIMARLKESNDVIAQLDTQIAAANAVLDEAKAKADSHFADMPSLQARSDVTRRQGRGRCARGVARPGKGVRLMGRLGRLGVCTWQGCVVGIACLCVLNTPHARLPLRAQAARIMR